jgi:hypothetical protein
MLNYKRVSKRRCPQSFVRWFRISIYGGFLSHGGSLKMNGLFHGKSYENMDDLGVPPWIGNHHISTTNPIIDVLFPLVG